MSTPVSSSPTPFRLGSCFVGQPVSGAHLGRWADEISFLAGANVNTICSCDIRKRRAGVTALTAINPKVYSAAYQRSAARVVRIEIDLHTGGSATITTTLPTGATWIDAGVLNGTASRPPPAGFGETPSLVGWVDVSGCALATSHKFSFSVSGTTHGIARLSITESPLASLDPVLHPDTEPALDAASTVAGNRIWDGADDGTTAYGTVRLAWILDKLRTSSRRHFQLVGVEGTDAAAYASNALWKVDGGGVDYEINLQTVFISRGWHCGTSDLYSGTDETWLFEVRYKTITATGGTFKVTVSAPDGSGALTYSITLAGTSGAWAWASGNVTIPVTHSAGEFRLKFQCNNAQAVGDGIFFATIAGIATPV